MCIPVQRRRLPSDAQKERRLLPDQGQQFVEVVGRRGPYRVLIRIAGSTEWSSPNLLLLISSHSCRSLIPSIVSRICSSS